MPYWAARSSSRRGIDFLISPAYSVALSMSTRPWRRLSPMKVSVRVPSILGFVLKKVCIHHREIGLEIGEALGRGGADEGLRAKRLAQAVSV